MTSFKVQFAVTTWCYFVKKRQVSLRLGFRNRFWWLSFWLCWRGRIFLCNLTLSTACPAYVALRCFIWLVGEQGSVDGWHVCDTRPSTDVINIIRLRWDFINSATTITTHHLGYLCLSFHLSLSLSLTFSISISFCLPVRLPLCLAVYASVFVFHFCNPLSRLSQLKFLAVDGAAMRYYYYYFLSSLSCQPAHLPVWLPVCSPICLPATPAGDNAI